MNLRTLINKCHLPDVYTYIFNKESDAYSRGVNLDKIILAYSKVIEDLKSRPEMSVDTKISVDYDIDWYWDYLKQHPDKKTKEDSDNIEDYKYINVSLLNSEYESEPPSNLAPWGGSSDNKNDCPEGYYNLNYKGYQKRYGISGQYWTEFVNMEIVNNDNLDDSDLLAEILWELTFHGFTEKVSTEFWEEMGRRVKEIDENNP